MTAGTKRENEHDTKNPKKQTLMTGACWACLRRLAITSRVLTSNSRENASERGIATEVVGAWGGAVDTVFARGRGKECE